MIKAYHALQREVAESAVYPSVTPEVHVEPDQRGYSHRVSLEFKLDPYRMHHYVCEPGSYNLTQYREVHAAFKRMFFEEYVPKLWAATEQAYASLGRW